MFPKWITSSYKDIIEFDEPQTLDESIRKAKYCYDHNKNKQELHKYMEGKEEGEA
jgi:hypothetical protein